MSDPRQARLLSDDGSFRFFAPFLGRERSATEAARELGCALDTLLYRIRTFREAGLLGVSRLEPRAGRPIKRYRSSADAYFVPFRLTPHADLEERAREAWRAQEDAVARGLARVAAVSPEDGQRIFRRPGGEVMRQSGGERGAPVDFRDPASLRRLLERPGPVGESASGTLRLSEAEAKRLLLELYELWSRYAAGEEGTQYRFAFALVPED